MTSSVTNHGKAFARIALAMAIAAMGIYVASSDPPGGAVVGFLLMLAAVIFGVRTARSRLPTWAGRTAVAVGALIAAFAAFLIHSIKVEAPLFAQAPGVPSVSASAPSPQLAAAADRARPMVRAAIAEQNLPGVSIAVGIGGGPGNIVWAEGFGWRDVVTMRDLACCAGKMAFYSTPSDLVRFALATNADSVDGELAGGSVMSLMTRRDNGIVVAVASNIAHANTAALARRVADTFAEQK